MHRSRLENGRSALCASGAAHLRAILITGIAICLLSGAALARDDDDDRGKFCTGTAELMYKACGYEVQDDYMVASAKCLNISDRAERDECYDEARSERDEAKQFCKELRDGRKDACRSLGENRYDPDFSPELFEEDFANLQNPNPYFPLRIGHQWEFRGEDEVNTVEVVNETKRIDGVRCVVVRDLVFQSGDLKEATDDWYAQARDGDTWYCGEEVKDFESFDGDDPRRPELVSIDGSFKAGRDRDKPGVIFLASPRVGASYIEEFSLGNAEDVTDILSTTYSFGSDATLDQFVPRPLVDLLCSGDCVVTKNYSLLEPGIFARKYYARGIGFFLEVKPESGDAVRLVSCNFDARCARLPAP